MTTLVYIAQDCAVEGTFSFHAPRSFFRRKPETWHILHKKKYIKTWHTPSAALRANQVALEFVFKGMCRYVDARWGALVQKTTAPDAPFDARDFLGNSINDDFYIVVDFKGQVQSAHDTLEFLAAWRTLGLDVDTFLPVTPRRPLGRSGPRPGY